MSSVSVSSRLQLSLDDSEAQYLLADYLDHFNSIFPLFDRKEVEAQMGIDFKPDPEQDVAWYAALNIMFAIGSIFEKVSSQGPIDTGLMVDPTDPKFTKSWALFGNCCSVLSELLFQDTNLTGLSALVAMV